MEEIIDRLSLKRWNPTRYRRNVRTESEAAEMRNVFRAIHEEMRRSVLSEPTAGGNLPGAHGLEATNAAAAMEDMVGRFERLGLTTGWNLVPNGSLLRLPNEVLHRVAALLTPQLSDLIRGEVDPSVAQRKGLAGLARTCLRLNSVATFYLYHTIDVHDSITAALFARTLVECPNARHWVKHLSISYRAGCFLSRAWSPSSMLQAMDLWEELAKKLPPDSFVLRQIATPRHLLNTHDPVVRLALASRTDPCDFSHPAEHSCPLHPVQLPIFILGSCTQLETLRLCRDEDSNSADLVQLISFLCSVPTGRPSGRELISSLKTLQVLNIPSVLSIRMGRAWARRRPKAVTLLEHAIILFPSITKIETIGGGPLWLKQSGTSRSLAANCPPTDMRLIDAPALKIALISILATFGNIQRLTIKTAHCPYAPPPQGRNELQAGAGMWFFYLNELNAALAAHAASAANAANVNNASIALSRLGDTLEFLHIDCHDYSWRMHDELLDYVTGRHIVSGLGRLRELRIGLQALTLHTRPYSDVGQPSRREGNWLWAPEVNPLETYRLAETLPSSLRRLVTWYAYEPRSVEEQPYDHRTPVSYRFISRRFRDRLEYSKAVLAMVTRLALDAPVHLPHLREFHFATLADRDNPGPIQPEIVAEMKSILLGAGIESSFTSQKPVVETWEG